MNRSAIRRVGVTSFSETQALFFIQFLSFRKMKVQDRQNGPSGLLEKNWLATRLAIYIYFVTFIVVSVYRTCIRPILEKACKVWHHPLPKYLSDQIESVQRRALNIIFPDTSYEMARDNANLPTLSERRPFLCNRLFRTTECPNHPINLTAFPPNIISVRGFFS